MGIEMEDRVDTPDESFDQSVSPCNLMDKKSDRTYVDPVQIHIDTNKLMNHAAW